MLKRRNLRVKVMQAIYAKEQDPNAPIENIKNNLKKNLEAYYKSYAFAINIFCKSALYSKETYLKENNINILQSNDILLKLAEKCDNSNFLIESWKYIHLEKGTLYKIKNNFLSSEQYNSLSKTDLKNDEKLANAYLEYLFQEDLFTTIMEENFRNWFDDEDAVFSAIVKILTSISKHVSDNIPLNIKFKLQNEEIKFATDIFTIVIEDIGGLTKMIESKTKNWDIDRIAQIDLILMKMALAELLHFDTIPVKVTINEYIDISKYYSTPKSKDFINGILDILLKDLQEAGKIQKVGRGLIG